MKSVVFYSWQSDTRAAANRTLIQDALESAAAMIAADGSIGVEPVLDRDTQNVAGSPDIGATILAKIEAADVVVADVTIINAGADVRLTPNPNVMIEVGYALATHTDARLVLVQNTAFGAPETLPFDLRQKRVVGYFSAEDDSNRASVREGLSKKLRQAIEAILVQNGLRPTTTYPIKLSLGFKTDIATEDIHEYRLRIGIANAGTKRITEWHADVEIPRRLLNKDEAKAGVPNRSTKERTVFRFTEEAEGPLYPDDTKVLQVSYHVDQDLFENHSSIFDQTIRIRAFVHGELAGSIEAPVRDLQKF